MTYVKHAQSNDYTELQAFVDNAGFEDLVIADLTRRGDSCKKITAIAGYQFATFDEPSYGETLLQTLLVEAISKAKASSAAALSGLIQFLMEVLPEECPTTESAEALFKAIISDVTVLPEETFITLTSAGLVEKLAQLRKGDEAKKTSAVARKLQNHLLVWFLNNRATRVEEANWTTAKLFGLSNSDLVELREFMDTELSGKGGKEGE